MDSNRQSHFNLKFASAARALGVTPDKIVSLKIRGNVNSYNEYGDLIHSLEREFGFQCSPVVGELQGHGYLLAKEKSKIILVEHETGLEILYIVGSIASIIGIIPLVLQGWKAVRRFANPENPFENVEIRTLDEDGELREHPAHQLAGRGITAAFNVGLAAVSLLEHEFHEMTALVERLSPRVSALEKRLGRVENKSKKKGPVRRSKKK